MGHPLSRGRSLPPLPPCEKPLVIAHRGASSEVAEHTLPAYLQAIETGADGLECDVRLTRDGYLVCVHDRTVNRTSNGQGIVSELDLSGLEALDFRSWHDELPTSADELLDPPYLAGVAPDRMGPDSSTVLTLETLLSVVAEAGRPLKLLIETKHPTRYGGLVEQELVRMLRRFGWAGGAAAADQPVTIMSFAGVALRRVRLLAPAVPLVLLLDRASALRRTGSLPTGVHTAGPGIRALRSEPSFVERVHAAGNRVYCWTVDAPEDVELVRSLGVDAIITNRPRQVRAQLGYT
jgi:glycerophosphoryl diester phosphodiesterase